jgi:hypothetical protein
MRSGGRGIHSVQIQCFHRRGQHANVLIALAKLGSLDVIKTAFQTEGDVFFGMLEARVYEVRRGHPCSLCRTPLTPDECKGG